LKEITMTYPAFFDDAPTITVHDALAEFLGASTGGVMTYHYVDAVRLAGHSCPTVAGAYLMTRRALQLLYPDQLPERGAMQVSFADAQDDGVTGVIGSVAGLITGAAGVGGFKGIAGQFRRQNLLQFGADMGGEARFTRLDTGATVELAMQTGRVPADARMSGLLQKTLSGRATPDEAQEFASLWQDRVRRILLEHADDPELIVVSR
jgi:formylmethanofuran dehydrogenase subunit E